MLIQKIFLNFYQEFNFFLNLYLVLFFFINILALAYINLQEYDLLLLFLKQVISQVIKKIFIF